MQLSEVRAVVTGAASGLGLSVATRIVRQGGRVAMLDVNAEVGYPAADLLGGRATFIATDITDEGGVDRSIGAACASLGYINAAINCAGIFAPARLVGRRGPMAGSHFRKVIEINLTGTVLVAKAAAAVMQANVPNSFGERGVIVMTASIAAFDGPIGQVAYAASKGAIVSITLPMARELAFTGIRVVTIAPGPFGTPMVAHWPQEAQDSLAQQMPFPHRLGEPAEFALLVTHILENVMLNGETIRLDGAMRLKER
jgi:NAD(P)-dependent dehydrogenase (short-subunit alcohol dehydrogenase family)